MGLFLNVVSIASTAVLITKAEYLAAERAHTLYALVACTIVAVLGYFVEANRSSSLQYLQGGPETSKTSSRWMQYMQKVAPVITMKVTCYHTELQRYRDSDGNDSVRETTAITHTASENMEFHAWADYSGALPSLYHASNLREVERREQNIPEGEAKVSENEDVKITLQPVPAVDVLVPKFHILQVRISGSVEAFDYETDCHLRDMAKQFQAKHEGRDTHMSYEQTVHLPGLQENILVTNGDPNCMVDLVTYWVATLLFMSWPYRIWLETKCAKVHWELKKVVSSHDDLKEGKQEPAQETCDAITVSVSPVF